MDDDCVEVLSVEDDQRIAELIKLALEPEGYCVRQCEDGVTALRCIDEQEPAVILLDLMIPLLDGREFVWELRRRRRSVPVIVISAVRDLPSQVARLPVQGFITKPFDIQQLVATVNSVVGDR